MSSVKNGVVLHEDAERLNAPYLLELSLENFRCFRHRQTLNLSDPNGKPSMWNVILGENGLGKTTLLIAILLTTPYGGQSEGNIIPSLLNENDYFRFFNSNYDFGIDRDYDIVYSPKSKLKNYFDKRIDLHVNANVEISMVNKNVKIFNLICTDNGRKYLDYEGVANMIYYLPLLVSYGASRLLDDSAITDMKNYDPEYLLTNPLIPLPNAEEWLVQADYAAKLDVDNPKQKQRLEMVKDLLCEFLPDVEDFKFGIAPGTTMTPRVEAKTPYGWVRVRDLSLGYQTALAWIVDFASRMMDRYPDSENPFAEPGICLVDEIDLHTHPKWQKELVHKLRMLFPKTQFIVTAHSPLIVQAAEDANIALLRREGDHVVIENDVDYIRNWRVDQILSSELFSNVGGESALSERLMAERTVLVERGAERTEADEARLQEIDVELDRLPSGSTSQDREAMDLIRDAAQWLKAAPKT